MFVPPSPGDPGEPAYDVLLVDESNPGAPDCEGTWYSGPPGYHLTMPTARARTAQPEIPYVAP